MMTTKIYHARKFYLLTAGSIEQGAAFVENECWVFSPITRHVAKTTYEMAIRLEGWARLASEAERAYCLSMRAELTAPCVGSFD